MRIGIIGAGNIGSTLARLWVAAGHEVLLSSRHPEQLDDLVDELGPGVSRGQVGEAATYGPVVLLAVPTKAIPGLAAQLGDELRGRIVLDACNPFPDRDGEPGREARGFEGGSGAWTAEHLEGARVVKAFNTVHYANMGLDAEPGEPFGVPLAGDDEVAVEAAEALVRDAGMEPVTIGPLAMSQRFDPGTEVWNSGMTGEELRRALGVDAT